MASPHPLRHDASLGRPCEIFPPVDRSALCPDPKGQCKTVPVGVMLDAQVTQFTYLEFGVDGRLLKSIEAGRRTAVPGTSWTASMDLRSAR